jgi:hypothetical protein
LGALATLAARDMFMVKAAMVTLGCFWGESGCDKEWMVYTVEDESC